MHQAPPLSGRATGVHDRWAYADVGPWTRLWILLRHQANHSSFGDEALSPGQNQTDAPPLECAVSVSIAQAF